MKGKLFGLLALCLAITSILACLASAATVPVAIDSVKVDGDVITSDDVNRLNVEIGDDIEVKVILTALEDAENIQVEAEIKGYEHDDRESTSDTTHIFDVEANVTYTKRLKLSIPSTVEEDNYKLRITVTDRYNDEILQNYNLKIDAPRHSMTIRDILLTPEGEITAGRALLASVRVKNLGDKDEDSVKVTVKIPSLGLSASDYIDEVEKDDSETSEELYLRIPVCAEEGTYDVVVRVEYDDGYEDISKATTIDIVESDICEASSAQEEDEDAAVPDVVVGSTLEDVVAGQGGAIFPVTITNNAATSKTFSLAVEGADDWGTVKISPTNTVVIDAGESESLYIFVAANENAASGPQVLTATVKAGSETVKQSTLTANVVEGGRSGSWNTAKKGLEIALVVLVALLVILGLIIGFSRLKSNEEGHESEDVENYY